MGNTSSKGPFSIAMLVYRSVILKVEEKSSCISLENSRRFGSSLFLKLRSGPENGNISQPLTINFHPQMLNVWPIYLHLGVNVGTYTSPIEHLGSEK